MSKALFIANPARRRKRRKARKSAAKRSRTIVIKANPAKRRKRKSYRRNPSPRVRRALNRATAGKGKLAIGSMIVPALSAGVGAVAVEALTARLPLPAMLKTGVAMEAVKGVVGIGLGMIVARQFNKQMGAAIAVGGLAIAANGAVRGLIQRQFPGANLGEYLNGVGYYNPGMPVNGIGEYIGDYSEMASLNFDDPLMADQDATGYSMGEMEPESFSL